MGAMLFATRIKFLSLKINIKSDITAIQVNEAKLIQDEGTWMYIILTLSPCRQSGGDIINAKVNATKSKIKKIELINFINFSIQINILLGFNRSNIAIDYYNIILL